MTALVGAFITLCLLLMIQRRPDLLLVATAAAGVFQGPVATWFQSGQPQLLDDFAVVCTIVYAGLVTLRQWSRQARAALVVIAIAALLVGFALWRSPDPSVGFIQAKQVLLPAGLIFAGYVLRESIRWRTVWRGITFLALLAAAWAVAEYALEKPLIDPTWYYLEVWGGDPALMRQGLPSAYIADDVGEATIFRAGGPFFNPPTLGYLLGAGALAVRSTFRNQPFMRYISLGILAGGLLSAYARAGIVIFIALTIVHFAWRRVGRFGTILIGIGIATYLVSIFMDQGNTAAHSDGLGTGLVEGVTNPLGHGFGTVGYQAILGGTSELEFGESLIGLYATWLGWPFLGVLAWATVRIWRNLLRKPHAAGLPYWAAVAMIIAAASSESASSMASTPVLWVLIGAALVYVSKSAPPDNATGTETTPAKASQFSSVAT